MPVAPHAGLLGAFDIIGSAINASIAAAADDACLVLTLQRHAGRLRAPARIHQEEVWRRTALRHRVPEQAAAQLEGPYRHDRRAGRNSGSRRPCYARAERHCRGRCLNGRASAITASFAAAADGAPVTAARHDMRTHVLLPTASTSAPMLRQAPRRRARAPHSAGQVWPVLKPPREIRQCHPRFLRRDVCRRSRRSIHTLPRPPRRHRLLPRRMPQRRSRLPGSRAMR